MPNFVSVLTSHAAAWQVPAEEVTALSAAQTAYKPLYAAATSPDKNSVVVAQKNAAKDVVIRLVRNMVNYRLANLVVVDNASRIELGLNVRDSNPSPVGIPTTAPDLTLMFPGIRCIDVHYKDTGSETKRRPAGTNGAVIYWAFSDTPITDLAALVNSDLATRTPYHFRFTEADRGKTIYIAMRWQSTHGKGPWSAIVSAAIP